MVLASQVRNTLSSVGLLQCEYWLELAEERTSTSDFAYHVFQTIRRSRVKVTSVKKFALKEKKNIEVALDYKSPLLGKNVFYKI